MGRGRPSARGLYLRLAAYCASCLRTTAGQARFRLGSFSHSRRRLSTRACQPRPDARSLETTSRERRMEMSSFVGVFCGPRCFLKDRSFSCSSAGRAAKGIAPLKSSLVHSGFSSSTVSGLGRFFIFSYLSTAGAAQADYAQCFTTDGINQRVKAIFDVSKSTNPSLAILMPSVFEIDGRFEIEVSRPRKRQSALPYIPLVLGRIEFDVQSLIVYTIPAESRQFGGFLAHVPLCGSVCKLRRSRKNVCIRSMQRAASTPELTSTW